MWGKSPPWGENGGGEFGKRHSLINGVQNIHTEFERNQKISQDWGIWGGEISPQGGNGGIFWKTDKTRPLVMCQRIYIPKLKTI